jgi:hypothetical protein
MSTLIVTLALGIRFPLNCLAKTSFVTWGILAPEKQGHTDRKEREREGGERERRKR